MKLQDITDVFGLTCVLCITYVNSQTLCHSSWFGPQCQYKCRCVNGRCFSNGECIGTSRCGGGWFGPACQYADLAYHTALNPAVVDGNDLTCLAGNATSITIKLNESQTFTWLRVSVTNDGSHGLRYLTLSFSDETSTTVACDGMKKQYVDRKTLDVHCDISDSIDNVTLHGTSAGHLCSVYISGGRNVALRENATQDTTHSEMVGGVNVSFTADKAVDGNTQQHLYNSLSCTLTGANLTERDHLPTWSVTLSKQRRITRYVIYNRVDALQNHLLKFKLEVFSTPSQSYFSLMDSNTQPRDNYTILHSPITLQKVAVSANNSEFLLSLCEVEIYGDSVCDAHHYGRECELECHCPNDEACFVATGGCPAICPAGFHGPNCSNECDAGTYGEDCESNCSHHCVATQNPSNPSCGRQNGACPSGCKVGYTGANCQTKCSAGLYGDYCRLSCSRNCEPQSDAKVSTCNHETGACVNGCKSGYTGGSCDSECKVGQFGKNCQSSCSKQCASPTDTYVPTCNHVTGTCNVGCKPGSSGKTCDSTTAPYADVQAIVYIVSACMIVASSAFVLYCLCTRIKTLPIEERKGSYT